MGLWMTYFFSLVSVFCNVVILLYNEKHIYFAERNVPELHAVNLRHKDAPLHCQGLGLKLAECPRWKEQGKENRPSILGGLVIFPSQQKREGYPPGPSSSGAPTQWMVLGLNLGFILPMGL